MPSPKLPVVPRGHFSCPIPSFQYRALARRSSVKAPRRLVTGHSTHTQLLSVARCRLRRAVDISYFKVKQKSLAARQVPCFQPQTRKIIWYNSHCTGILANIITHICWANSYLVSRRKIVVEPPALFAEERQTLRDQRSQERGTVIVPRVGYLQSALKFYPQPAWLAAFVPHTQ